MKLTGRCYCGDVHYEIEGEAQASLHCHCRECQYVSGGNPAALMIFPLEAFRLTQGEMKQFRRSDLERPVTRHFCEHCGTGLASETPYRPGSIVVKVGTLDDPSVFTPAVAIFTCDKQAFHHIPEDIPAFDKRPG